MVRRGYSERHREQSSKNKMILVALLAFCAIVYVVFITRAGLLG
jgi:hypothetical protein